MSHDFTQEIPELDPSFVFDFEAYDDLGDGQRWSTWLDVEPLCRGPEPRPDWVVTSQAAVDTDLGVLKTGKEADAFLVERAVPGSPPPDQGGLGESVVMVAKRYRSNEHRTFHRAASYTEGRSVKRSRDERALKRKSTWGKIVASQRVGDLRVGRAQALLAARAAGPLPGADRRDRDPDGVDHRRPGESAPRLAQTRPEPELLASYFDQLRDALATLVSNGIVHGDLSAYNLLAAGERLVIIDLPQIVDLVGNINGLDFLMRDCANVCTWFRARGLDVDEHELFGELMAHAF